MSSNNIVRMLVLVLSTTLSCNSQNIDESLIETDMILPINGGKMSSLVFVNNKIYTIVQVRNGGLTSTKSIIYSSLDEGVSWVKVSSIDGMSRISDNTEETLFIVTDEFTENSFNNQKHYIHFYNIENDSILKSKEFKEYIHSVVFKDDLSGGVFLRRSGRVSDYNFLGTENGGESWSDVDISKPVLITFKNQNMIYFSSYSENMLVNDLYKIDQYQIFPMGLNQNIVDFIIDDENDIWLIGKDEQGQTEITKYEHNERVLVKKFKKDTNLSPKKILKQDRFISVLLKEDTATGTINRLYVSHDNGNKWREVLFSNEYILESVVLTESQNLLCYNMTGEIFLYEISPR